jgi:DNA-binding MarR family transcriptional regulator
MLSKTLYLRLHRALREFPRYNQFLDKVHGLEMAPVESHILVEVGGKSGLSVKDLNILLGLEKSIVSKLIKKFATKKILITESAPHDRREKILYLTKRGQELLALFDRLSNQNLREFDAAAQFTSGEVLRISLTLTKLADSLHAPSTVIRKLDHPLRPVIRRLTRSFQLLVRRAMGSNLNTLEWQTLLTISQNTECLTPTQVGSMLKASKSATAVALAELERQGFIVRHKTEGDQRSFQLELSKAGFDLIAAFEAQAIKSYSAFRGITLQEVERIERWMRAAAIVHNLNRNEMKLQTISSSEVREHARRLTLAKYLMDEFTVIPSKVFHESSRSFALFRDTLLLAAVEFSPSSTNHVLNLYFESSLPLETIRAFVAYANDPRLIKSVDMTQSPYRQKMLSQTGANTTMGMLFA